MEYINPLNLIEYLKFGYQGETIDLIYLILLIRFVIWPFIHIIYNFYKRRVK